MIDKNGGFTDMPKDAQYRYALRKLSIGVVSVAIGFAITPVVTNSVQADVEQQVTDDKRSSTNTTNVTDEKSDISTETENISNTPDVVGNEENLIKAEGIRSEEQAQTNERSTTNTEQSPITSQKNSVENSTEQDDVTPNNVEVKSPVVGMQNVESQPANKVQVAKAQVDKSQTIEAQAAEPREVESQVTESSKEIDPTLVTSVKDKLSAVEYNVFDIREATEIWANDQLKNMYLADNFKKIHDQLPTLTKTLLEHADDLETAGQRTSDNAAAIMLGMSYIDRWYNISYGDKELLPLMMFDPKSFGSKLDSIDWLTKIGQLSYDELLPKNNVKTFNQKLAPMLNVKTDLFTFLDDLRKKWSPELTDDEWFKSNTGVHIVEIASKEVPELDLRVYHRFTTGNDKFKSFVLPLLNIKNDDMYIVSTLGVTVFGLYDPYIDRKYYKEPTVYREKVKQVHEKLDHLSTAWRDHFDFWYRITNEIGKKRLTEANIQIWDSYDALDSSKKGGRVWLSKYDTVSPGMAEFFGSVGEKYDAAGVSADATGDMVRYYVAKTIDEFGGASILSHEMVHNFDSLIYLDGYGRRPGAGVELFADGLLQSPWTKTPGHYSFNTVLTFDSDGRTTNKGPARFQTREDLQEYMKGIFDVTYLLDYAEAQAMLSKSTSDKQLMYSQISYDPTKKADVVSGPISAQLAEKLKTIDDFIDNNIIASRGYQKGNYGNNAYQQISLYAPDYAGIQSATSVSGAITFRKTAFELLAAKGWENGFIAYVSDKYANDAKKAKKPLSDTYKLEKILAGEYNNDYATFKKAMFKERIDKRNYFKPLTITLNKKTIQLNNWDELQKLMQTTVDQELIARKKGQKTNLINNLKAAVLAAEIKQTDDFRNTIFNAKQENKGEILGDGTSYDLPKYDLDSLKQGEVLGDGTSYDLPKYDLDSLKQGEILGDGTSYDLPKYDLDSLKQGEALGEGTSYDLPKYDLDSLKQGEILGDGTSYDLPKYDLDSLKQGEALGDGTSYDLPKYDLDSLKQGEILGDGTSYDLPKYDLDLLKKDDVDNERESKDNDLASLDQKTSDSIKVYTDLMDSNNDSQSQKLYLREDQNQGMENGKLNVEMSINMKGNNDDHKTSLNIVHATKTDVELPQTGEKDDFIGTILTAFSTISAALGISLFRRKNNLEKRK